jgi:hypothetical protein
MWFYKFNRGFAHLLYEYGGGVGKYKKMKQNICLLIMTKKILFIIIPIK